MGEILDPKEFGLPAGCVIERLNGQMIALVVNRKSRIIMSDGKKILEKISTVRKARPRLTVALKTTAPICSKTMDFFESENIQVLSD